MGQLSAGGQSITSAKFAVQHGATHGLVELAVQRHIVLLTQARHFGEQ
jgi:hypothetical protein